MTQAGIADHRSLEPGEHGFALELLDTEIERPHFGCAMVRTTGRNHTRPPLSPIIIGPCWPEPSWQSVSTTPGAVPGWRTSTVTMAAGKSGRDRYTVLALVVRNDERAAPVRALLTSVREDRRRPQRPQSLPALAGGFVG